MNALDEVRKKGPPPRFRFALWLAAAVLQAAAALMAAYGGSGSMGVLFLCAVPFFVVSAQSVEQARVNHALLKEIDALRALVSRPVHAPGDSGPGHPPGPTSQSLPD